MYCNFFCIVKPQAFSTFGITLSHVIESFSPSTAQFAPNIHAGFDFDLVSQSQSHLFSIFSRTLGWMMVEEAAVGVDLLSPKSVDLSRFQENFAFATVAEIVPQPRVSTTGLIVFKLRSKRHQRCHLSHHKAKTADNNSNY